MLIRPVQIEDVDDLFLWRNDPHSTAMFVENAKVSREDHEIWFKNSLNSSEREIYLGVLDNQKVGVCRFDYKAGENAAEVSINLNPSMRGRKLSFKLLSGSIEKYREKNSCLLTATIKIQNTASRKIFEKCGFRIAFCDEHYWKLLKSTD